jgi:antirestriction protein ArdC
MKTTSTSRFDVYEAITNQIIAAIEAGAGNVQLPWHRSGSSITRPVNIASGNGYRGINTIALWAAADAFGFEQGIWGTYRQWQERGAQVRKGEKSSLIVFYRQFEPGAPADADDTTDSAQRRFIAKASHVFNLAQVDGYTPESSIPEIDQVARDIRAEQFIAATGATVQIGGERAFYRPSTDEVRMPDRIRFTGTATSTPTESWYSTLLHELTHWSGAQHRLDRQFGARFGDDAYAMEELVAELGAAFLCGDLGITAAPRPDHAAYVNNWLQVLKGDRKAIFTAASAANKAADYLRAFSES